MQIILNGEKTEIKPNLTISDLIKKFELSEGKIAIELNREIIAIEEYENIKLQINDQIEIVEFVGGG